MSTSTVLPVIAAPRAARLTTSVTVAGWVAVAAALTGEWALPGGWGGRDWIPLVVALLVGVPHGAVDHVVPTWWLGGAAPNPSIVGAVYAATGLAAYALLVAAPLAATAGFAVLSAWHFATGEAEHADLRAGRPAIHVAVRSAGPVVAVLVLPALLHPGRVVDLIKALTGADASLTPELRAVGVVAAAAVLAVALFTCARVGRWLDAIELALLVLLAATVSPLVTFGVWFGAFHSARHVVRCMVDDPANAAGLRVGRERAALLRFARAAAIPSVVAYATIGVTWWGTSDGWRGFLSAYLLVIAALTVPHMLVVGWADRQRHRARGEGR